jgi:hypothetical protein
LTMKSAWCWLTAWIKPWIKHGSGASLFVQRVKM